MSAIPRYRHHSGPALLSAGFRPFFLLSALWAFAAVPLWLEAYAGGEQLPTMLPFAVWHAHEMVFGFGAATVAGFLLTAIPNWTGRMPLQGGPLGLLALLWASGRFAVLFSAHIGAIAAAVVDLAFPLLFAAAIARELIAGRNWRNLPVLIALTLLFVSNLLVHLSPLGVADTATVGNRLGIATLLMLVSLIGGRIIPSFTRNWLAKQRPDLGAPAAFTRFDRAVLGITAVTLALWVAIPDGPLTPWFCIAAGVAHGVRLGRWRGPATLREPLLWVLHLGYGWLAFGFCLLGLDALVSWLPQTTALHALTIGAIGTMTLAVMTRATLGHTGRPLAADVGTTAIYALVSLATILRLIAPLAGEAYVLVLSLSAAAWSGAFGLFVLLYGRALTSSATRPNEPASPPRRP
ncbi:MAG: NnrS family protein [Acetobacteraceae bacterium]|nr:NnrS family protein [Acetobacteraceae bacterium]